MLLIILLNINDLYFFLHYLFFIENGFSVSYTIALSIDFYNLAAIQKSVKDCGGEHFIVQCFCPLCRSLVRCDYQ